jgi:uridine kinase
MLPLLQLIDAKMQPGRPLILAIEGSAASGKSTLGHLLQQIYHCNLLHADDFFLQPHQRTPERFAQVGGNFDRERFLSEVLLPLRKGETLAYRRYDCHTQTILPPVEIPPAPLSVIEGVYSFHPELQEYYDLAVFLRISPELQRSRICRRNTPEFQSLFFDRWIPMEQKYFNIFSIPESCHLILEVDE